MRVALQAVPGAVPLTAAMSGTVRAISNRRVTPQCRRSWTRRSTIPRNAQARVKAVEIASVE